MDTESITKEFIQAIGIIAKYSGSVFDEDEVQEYISECWIRYLCTDDSTEKADPFLCGKRAVVVARRKQAKNWDQLHLDDLPMSPLFDEHYESEPLDSEINNALLNEFYQQRVKRGERGLEAAMQEVLILDLLHQGWSDEGIALELGIAWWSVRTYRNRIRERLRILAEKKNISIPRKDTDYYDYNAIQ